MSQGPNPYLKTKVLTASPQELRLMLYEGAIKFCLQARGALEQRDLESSYHGLIRAQKIVLELSSSLNHQTDPDLCDKLSALYTYIYRRLVEANMERDPSAVDEALELLRYEKQTWELLMERAGRPAPTATTVPAAPAYAGGFAGGASRAVSSLSIRG